MSIYVGNSEVRGIYLGTTPVQAVYKGTTKIWPPAPSWPFIDTFNRAALGAGWSGTGAEIAKSSYLRATDAPPSGSATYRYPVWAVDVDAPADMWEVTVTLKNIPDAVQSTRVMVGQSATNCQFIRIGNGGIQIGWVINGTESTVAKATAGFTLAAGTTVTLKRTDQLLQGLVNGTMRTADVNKAVATGAGNRKLCIEPSVFRGGFLNQVRYHSPGIDSVTFT